jgi:hypothetical protein
MRGIALAVLIAALALPAGAGAQTGPYDGSNPFDCVLQDVGFGTDFPDPDADPFCVEFDKRRQNLTELGIVDFLAQEPARVAAASPKCFYYQHDHWTSRVQQDVEGTELYNWDGAYWFDKARATGGVYIENFTFNNQTQDPRVFPGFPEEWKPFFGPGRGGVQFSDSGVEADPSCVALARSKNVYSKRAGGGPAAGGSVGCLTGHGSIGRGVPGARLGARRARVYGALGRPTKRRRRSARWCTAGDGVLVAAFRRRRLAAVISTSPAFDLRGIAAGDSGVYVRRRLEGERTISRRGRSRVLAVGGRRLRLVRLRRGRVHWVGAARRGPRAASLGFRAGGVRTARR